MSLLKVRNKFMCSFVLVKGCFIIKLCVCVPRYVSIKPDNRKLANGTNVLGLLIDTLLKEGFHLVSTRTISSEDKSECYSFARIKSPEALAMNKIRKPEATIMPEQPEKKK